MGTRTSKKQLLTRIDYLENNMRFIQGALEMALSLGDFQENIHIRFDPIDILKESEKRIRHLIPFDAMALYLVEEESSDFISELCNPDQFKKYIEDEVEFMIGKGLFGWALRERRGVVITSKDHSRQFLLHVVATYSRIRGMFIGLLPFQSQKIPNASLTLLSIILLNTANALESLELYKLMHDQKIILEQKVEERTKQLLRYERKLQQIERMEAIGTLAGGVAHDLNNILAGIIGYPQLLLIQLPEDSPLRKPILTIEETGKKAAAIVQDLLTMARRGVCVSEVVNLNDVISEYLQSPVCEKLKFHHPYVEIETDLGTNLSNIIGSPVHLNKTIMNLVSNAAEAMVEEGRILISTGITYVERPIKGYEDIEKGEYITLTVSDTGTGISSEDMEKIFEPFYTKKEMGRSGTGLGMAVVWGTVKDHKGYIDIQSAEGKGTSFILYFPVTSQKTAEDKCTVSFKDYMGAGESILVVDDVKEQREIADRMLTTLGYLSKAVSSGEEATEFLKENSADLVLLDMIMNQGINGRETYEKILKIHPNQKAIIASGFSETDDVKIARNLGAGQFIKKPYTIEEIAMAIKTELER